MFGAGHAGELVDVVVVVLALRPVGRKFGYSLVEVTGSEQRRRVEREEAGVPVVGDGGG